MNKISAKAKPELVTETTIATSDATWFVYLMRCADNSLYTGITSDLNRRFKQHNAGTASRYTRSRLPVVLAYQELQESQSHALKRELAIKWTASERSIRDSVRNAIRVAQENRFISIAFPLIGAGSGSFNQDQSKAMMLDELGKFDVEMVVKVVVFMKAKR